jgi:hypothetical protein
MSVGAALGAAAGAPLGPVGAALGAGAASLALPAFVGSTAEAVRKPMPEKAGLVDYLGRATGVVGETAKGAVMGGALGTAARWSKLLEVSPGMKQLAKTAIGRSAIKGAAEMTVLTGGEAISRGEMPSVESVADNALFLAALSGSHHLSGLSKKVVPAETREKAVSEMKQAGEKVLSKLPAGAGEYIKKKFWLHPEQSDYAKRLYEHSGEKGKRLVESEFKWHDALTEAHAKESLTPKQLEEAIYYRQKTGNPSVKNDTYESLQKRIPDSLKKVVNVDIDQHFRKLHQEINAHPFLKNISPREGLAEKYLPGFYEDPVKARKFFEGEQKQLTLKNPFAGMKEFLDFNEAAKKAGLKPRYKNIIDFVRAYDKKVAEMITTADLMRDIPKLESLHDKRLVVSGHDKEAYQAAKNEGYAPFEDSMLRRYISGGDAAKFKSSEPALVDPRFTEVFSGVFQKDRYKPTTVIGKAFDSLSDAIRYGRVQLSPFHHIALTESTTGAMGVRKGASFRAINKEGSLLRSNKEFMKEAAASNLNIGSALSRDSAIREYRRGRDAFSKTAEFVAKKLGREKLAPKAIQPVTKMFGKAQGYLFEKLHPNMKAVSWKHMSDSVIDKLIAEGKPPTTEKIKQIRRESADMVNNMLGGQNWDIMPLFNNPAWEKWIRRSFGYADWSASAAKQATNVMYPGVTGALSRKYWLRYGMNMVAFHSIAKFLNSGWKQTDQEDYKLSGLRWDYDKAIKETLDPDPSRMYHFPLPDVNMQIAGVKFNPGRNQRGQKVYGHIGKQALEIRHWLTSPIATAYSKMNPIAQLAVEQATGRTLSEGHFTVRGKPVGGKGFLPWDAAEPGSAKEHASRALHLLTSIIPFGVRTITDKGVAPYVASGLGAIPVSTGLSPYKAKPMLVEAFQKRDPRSIKRIVKALEENYHSKRAIKAVVKAAREAVRKS